MIDDMLYAGIFVFELFILFLLSGNIHLRISSFIFSLIRNKNITVYILAFLFLPGTFLHEFAHWVTAKILFVPAGGISLSPKLIQDSLRLGSVEIQKKDPFRRILIGTAPVFMGLGIILGVLYFVSRNGLFENLWIILLLGYVVFEIGNTMFSSKKDMEGAIGFLGVVSLIAGVGYIFGLRMPLSNIEAFFSQSTILTIFQKGSLYLLFPIVVDAILLLILKVLHR